MSQLKKPLYTIQIESSYCRFDIKINDGLAKRDTRGFPLILELPVNEWLVDGNNALELNVFSQKSGEELSEDANLRITVYVREIDQATSERKETVKIEFDAKAENASTTIRNSFSAQVPYDSWDWLKSGIISDSFSDKDEALKSYKEIWNALKNKDIAVIRRIIERREEDFSRAYYEDILDRIEDSLEYFESLFNGDELGLFLADFNEKSIFKLYGSSRLACFEDSDGKPAIQYRNQNGTIKTFLNFFLFKNKEGVFQTIR